MRGTGIIAGAFLAWALGLIDGEAIARVQSPHVATSMASGADAGQVQSVILGSPTFQVGSLRSSLPAIM